MKQDTAIREGGIVATTCTPGPWLIGANIYHVVDCKGYTIADVARAKDAPIIRVAPDMLAALKACLPILKSLDSSKEDDDEDLPLITQIEITIAKAEGRG